MGLGLDSKYLITEGRIFKSEIVDFPRYYLDLLLADERFSKFVISFKDYDTGKEYKRDEKVNLFFRLIILGCTNCIMQLFFSKADISPE
jgi:hypothetical protein